MILDAIEGKDARSQAQLAARGVDLMLL